MMTKLFNTGLLNPFRELNVQHSTKSIFTNGVRIRLGVIESLSQSDLIRFAKRGQELIFAEYQSVLLEQT